MSPEDDERFNKKKSADIMVNVPEITKQIATNVIPIGSFLIA